MLAVPPCIVVTDKVVSDERLGVERVAILATFIVKDLSTLR